jgi:hypothetical protein
LARPALLVVLASCFPRHTFGFVLNGVNSSLSDGALPGEAYRWTVPAQASATQGLGGGLSWVMDETLCENILGQFPERLIVRGLELGPWFDFVSCTDVQSAIHRGFRTWSDNHRLVSFSELTHVQGCEKPTGKTDDPCPWELYITTDDGEELPDLAAYVYAYRDSQFHADWYSRPIRSSAGVVATGVDAYSRSKMAFQTHLCWYLDATFCYYYQNLEESTELDVGLTVRATLFTLFGLACVRLLLILFWVLMAMMCVKEGDLQSPVRKRGKCSAKCSAVLDYLSSLSPLGNIIVIFFLTFPPIFYDRIFLPCWECYDFEAAAAHEMGHVLGFGHPDENTAQNLVGLADCYIGNSTCRDPFSCAKNEPYVIEDDSIMHSVTTRRSRTCLSSADLQGLHFLYPLCDDETPLEVSCTKSRQLSGWLRLALTTGIPFVLAVVLILVPLICLRVRDRRHMKKLTRQLSGAQLEIDEYQKAVQTLLQKAVRDSVRPVTAAMSRGQRNAREAARPGTAALYRAVSGRKVHPAPEAGDASTPGEGSSSPEKRKKKHKHKEGDAGSPEHRERKEKRKKKHDMALEDVQEEPDGHATPRPRPVKPPALRSG